MNQPSPIAIALAARFSGRAAVNQEQIDSPVPAPPDAAAAVTTDNPPAEPEEETPDNG